MDRQTYGQSNSYIPPNKLCLRGVYKTNLSNVSDNVMVTQLALLILTVYGFLLQNSSAITCILVDLIQNVKKLT